jgi:hypothetical protein
LSNLTPAERSARARIGAHAQHARHDARETTKPARAAMWRRFEDQVDPGRILPEDERRRRAKHAQQEHMLRMAFRSARARRKAKAS